MTDDTDLRSELLEEQPEEKPKRSIWGLVGAIAIVVIIILILLMLPQCSASRGGNADTGDKKIVSAPEGTPASGLVSVWISSKTDIDSVLAEAGIGSGPTELEEGKYIVTVPAGKEAYAIKQLKAQQGVFDAGRVYQAAEGK